MDKGHTIKVLDHGFVKLIDWMGSDEAIVEAARMSTGRGFVSWSPYKRCRGCDSIEGIDPLMSSQSAHVHDWQNFPRGDLGLLDTMWKNGHATPFEFGQLHVEVQAPLMVFREWHRHRTQSYSEFSARYSQMPDLHYLPDKSRIQKQSTSNRQGSGEAFPDFEAESLRGDIAVDQIDLYNNYEAMLKRGVAKEVARVNTPVSRYSKMRATANLRNWLAFLKLRMHPTAQWEIRQFAGAVAQIVEAVWPRTYALFVEHDRDAVKFSAGDAALLRKILRNIHGAEAPAQDLAALLKKLGA